MKWQRIIAILLFQYMKKYGEIQHPLIIKKYSMFRRNRPQHDKAHRKDDVEWRKSDSSFSRIQNTMRVATIPTSAQ